MKTHILIGALLASALTLSGCGQGGGAGNTAGNATGNTSEAPGAGSGGAAESNSSNSAAPAASEGGAGADATNQNFTIRNRTGQTIRELYVSAVSSNEWEEDVLGADTLPNGEAAQIRFERSETQCNWDIRVVFENDQSLEQRNVNLCQTTEIEVGR